MMVRRVSKGSNVRYHALRGYLMEKDIARVVRDEESMSPGERLLRGVARFFTTILD